MSAAISNFARALTWTLAHSLWVGASAALCLCALLSLLHSRRARWRYAASAGALISVPLIAIWTLSREMQGDPSEFQVLLDSSGEDGSALGNSFGVLLQWADSWRALLASQLEPLENWIMGGWLFLTTLAFGRVAGGWALLRLDSTFRLQRSSPLLQARVARLGRRIGVHRRVPVYWSERAEVPMVIGAVRPKIVLPSRLEAAVERGEYDLVLLHELAHVRRNDAWARTGEALIQALFVVNPAISWIASRVAREREHCCDDIALAAGADRLGYVRALASLESARAPGNTRSFRPRLASLPALRSTDGALVERIRRLTSPTPRTPRSRLAVACGGLFLGSAGLAVGALPTHAGRGTLAFAEELPDPIELEATATAIPEELDSLPDGQLAAPIRTGVARIVVLARRGTGVDNLPARLWLNDDVKLVHAQRIDGEDGAAAATQQFIRIEAVKSSR